MGVIVAKLQMPSRSGWPSGVRSGAAVLDWPGAAPAARHRIATTSTNRYFIEDLLAVLRHTLELMAPDSKFFSAKKQLPPPDRGVVIASSQLSSKVQQVAARWHPRGFLDRMDVPTDLPPIPSETLRIFGIGFEIHDDPCEAFQEDEIEDGFEYASDVVVNQDR